MYLNCEIQEARLKTVELHLAISNAWLDASERLSGLLLKQGRTGLAASIDLLENLNSRDPAGNSRLTADSMLMPYRHSTGVLEEFLEIIDDTGKSMVTAVESQIRVLDRFFYAVLDRSAKSSPWEAEITLKSLRAAVQSAEVTLHGIVDTAVQAIALAEDGIRQVTEGEVSVAQQKAAPPQQRALVGKE